MDSKDELRKPLSCQPSAIRKDNLGRPLSIPEDKLDVVLKLPVDWTQTYKKFAVTLCLQYPLAIGFCMLVLLSREDEIFKTVLFAVSHGKFVAIGYAVLVLFTSLISLLLLKEQTQMYFQFWQKRRDLKNIKIVYQEPCRYWFKLQFQTQIQYSCPLIASPTVGIFFLTFVPYFVAGIIIGSKEMIIGLIVGGCYAGFGISAILYPVTLAFDERILNLLTCDN